MVVQAEPEQSLTVPSIHRAEQEIRLTPGGASVVDPKTYETGRASTLSDALQYAPGVFVQPRFGADEARISIRGSGIQRTFHGRGIVLLQDGVPLNLADGSFDMQAVEPLGLQYIEVFRGANALQYGATTLGGAINFVANTGYTSDLLRLRGELGSWGYYKGFVSNGGVKDNFDWNVMASYATQDGYRDWAQQENARVFGNFGWRINPDLETRFFLTALNSDSQLPGTLTKAQAQSNPRQANAGNLAGRQKRDFPLYRIANKTAYRTRRGSARGGRVLLVQGPVAPDLPGDRPGVQRLRPQPAVRHRGAARRVPEPLRRRLDPAMGYRERQPVRQRAGPGRRPHRRFRSRTRRTTCCTPRTGSLSRRSGWASLGAQATRAERKVEDKFLQDGNQSVDQRYDRVSPKVGVLYKWSPQVDVFANYSGSYEPPTFGELTGGPNVTPLSAQSGKTFEVGTRGFLPAVQWDFAYYRSELKNELLSLNSPTGQPLGTVNAPDTMHQGIELGLVVTVDQIQSRTSYLWNDFRFRNNASFGDNRLPGIPPQFLRTELLYLPAPGWYVGPTLEWSLQRYPVDMANTLYVDGYAIWGLKAGRQVAKGFGFFVEGRNLSNTKYTATSGVIANANGQDSAQFWPGDGRAVYAGLEWRM